MLHRRAFIVAVAALVMLSAGCSTSRGTPNPPLQPSSQVAFDFNVPAGQVAVRMHPTEPQTPPFAGSLGRVASQALAQPVGSGNKAVSYTQADLVKDGSGFSLLLPYTNVDPKAGDPTTAEFKPSFSPGGGLDNLAFAMYDFKLLDYGASGHEQTIGFQLAMPPAKPEDFWIGLANRSSNSWDWFPYEEDNVITIGSFDKYALGDGSVRVALVALGMQQIDVLKILIGLLETRGTGETYAGFEPPAYELPHFFPPIDLSVDLSPECAPINDQGHIGSCTAFATTDGALNYELGQLYSCWDFSSTKVRCAPRFVYNSTGALPSSDPCPDGGRSTWEVGDWLIGHGTSNEEHTPYGSLDDALYDCGTTFSGPATFDSTLLGPTGKNLIGTLDGATGNYYLTDEDIADIKFMLLHGQVVVFRTNLDNNFGMVDYSGGQSWAYAGPKIGGHAMAMVGYDNDLNGGSFKVRNSWGTDFGDDGYCYITYAGMKSKPAGVYAYSFNVDYDTAVLDRFCPGPIFFPLPIKWRFEFPPKPDGVTLAWEPPPGVIRFKIFRDDPKMGPIATPKADEMSFTDITLQDNLAHVYWIEAVYGNGSSGLSRPTYGWLVPAV